jgi:hypothetical protein
MTSEDVRRLALELPGASEQDHHGRPSFRVNGRIFATIWNPQQLNVMIDGHRISQMVRDHPDRCGEVRWGQRLAAVSVELGRADTNLVASLLAEAWNQKRIRSPSKGRK